MTDKVTTSKTPEGKTLVWYYCPACKHRHYVDAKRWNWNGDLEKPTFHPSVRHFYPNPDTGKDVTVCHYHVREGKIHYCTDCPHEYAGKVVDLPDMEEE